MKINQIIITKILKQLEMTHYLENLHLKTVKLQLKKI